MDNSTFADINRTRCITRQLVDGADEALRAIRGHLHDDDNRSLSHSALVAMRSLLSRNSIPVLVCGATGSGKSSFVNEFLGKTIAIAQQGFCSARVTVYQYDEHFSITLKHGIDDCVISTTMYGEEVWANDNDIYNLILNFTGRPAGLTPQNKEERLAEFAATTVVVKGPFEKLPIGVEVIDSPGWGESEVLSGILSQVLKRRPLLVYLYKTAEILATEAQFHQFLRSNYPCSCGTTRCSAEDSRCSKSMPIFYLCNFCDRRDRRMEHGYDSDDDTFDWEFWFKSVRQARYKWLVDSPIGAQSWPDSVEDCKNFACLSTGDMLLDRRRRSKGKEPETINYHFIDFDKKFTVWVYESEAAEIMHCVAMVLSVVGGLMENIAGITDEYLHEITAEVRRIEEVTAALKKNVRKGIKPLFNKLAVDLAARVSSESVKNDLILQAQQIHLRKYDGCVIGNADEQQIVRSHFLTRFEVMAEKQCTDIYQAFNAKLEKAVSDAYAQTFESHAAAMGSKLLNQVLLNKFSYQSKFEKDVSSKAGYIVAMNSAVGVSVLTASGYATAFTNLGFVLAATGAALGGAALAFGVVAFAAYMFSSRLYDAHWKKEFATALCKNFHKLSDPDKQADTATAAFTKAYSDAEQINKKMLHSLQEKLDIQDSNMANQMSVMNLLGKIQCVCIALQNEEAVREVVDLSATPMSQNAFSSVRSGVMRDGSSPLNIRVPHSPVDSSPLEVFMNQRIQWVTSKISDRVSHTLRPVMGRCAEIKFPMFSLRTPKDPETDFGLRLGDTSFQELWYVVEPTNISLEEYLCREMVPNGRYTWMMIHRNLSADSIFLSVSPSKKYPPLRLLDFSVACMVGAVDKKQTNSYLTISPEQKSDTLLSAREGLGIDIFAFGILVWEALPKLAFVKGNILICWHTFPPNTPKCIRDLILKCLDDDYSKRPSPEDTRAALTEMRGLVTDLPPLPSGSETDRMCVVCYGEVSPTECTASCGHLFSCTNCFPYFHECPRCHEILQGRHEEYFERLGGKSRHKDTDRVDGTAMDHKVAEDDSIYALVASVLDSLYDPEYFSR